MTDLTLVEITRALRQCYPDRAERLIRELEVALNLRIVIPDTDSVKLTPTQRKAVERSVNVALKAMYRVAKLQNKMSRPQLKLVKEALGRGCHEATFNLITTNMEIP